MRRDATELRDLVEKAELLNQQFVSVYQKKTIDATYLPVPWDNIPPLCSVTCSLFNCLANMRQR